MSKLASALLPSAPVPENLEGALLLLISNGLPLLEADGQDGSARKPKAFAKELAASLAEKRPRAAVNFTWMLILRFEVHRADPTRAAAFLRKRGQKVDMQAKTNEGLNELLEFVNATVGSFSFGRSAWSKAFNDGRLISALIRAYYPDVRCSAGLCHYTTHRAARRTTHWSPASPLATTTIATVVAPVSTPFTREFNNRSGPARAAVLPR